MIPLMRNTFVEEHETRRRLAEFIVRAPRLSMDVECLAFEAEFAAYQGVSEAVLFNSGGSANLALLQALRNLGRLREGDKVGFSALTWSTNVMPILQMGLRPVPVDCSRKSLNVMASDVEATLREVRLDALFLTNVLGFAGDLEEIRAICEKQGVLLLEDNCEALGTELPSGRTGNFGQAATFSFFVAHHMSTIEGGMATTRDESLAEMLRIVRANGWDRNLSASQQRKWRDRAGVRSEFEAKYTFYDLAFNLRPTEITGFLGRIQLGYLEDNLARRLQNHVELEMCVRENRDLSVVERGHIRRLSPFAFPVVCSSRAVRDRYLAQFSGAGVEVRPMIAGNMQRQPFFRKYVQEERPLPEADALHECAFYCGNYPELTRPEIETLKSCLLPC
jgi:CDP-4-dehydro-6-deoxyglucose reductase, E1